VTAQMQGLKRSQQAVAGEVLTSLSGFAPALLLALGTRLAFRIPQRSLNTVTTNVPGPQHPLFLAGRRMLEAIPYVPVANQVRIGVAIFSYDGALKFGVTGDYDSAPDIRVLCEGIEKGMVELVKAAQPGGRPAARTGAKTSRPAQAAASPAPGSTSGAAEAGDSSSRETT
jgi:diacylglycerol O-acyltransferase